VAVSNRDRAHLVRLGACKAESHAEALSRHLELPLADRVERSWALYEAQRGALRARDDDPSPFYARARALGLYRP
jgi:hypothetical protein